MNSMVSCEYVLQIVCSGKGPYKYFKPTDAYLPRPFEISDKIVNKSGSISVCMLLPFISLILNTYLRKAVYKKTSC